MVSSKPKEKSDETLLDDFIARIVPVYNPERIYLFGSRARGNARPESDYDLLILVADDVPRELKTAGKAYTALWGITSPVDVVVWTVSDFDKELSIPNSLPAMIVREGKVLYVSQP